MGEVAGLLPLWRGLSPRARSYLFARAASACALGIVIVLLNLYLDALGLGPAFMGLSFSVFSLAVGLASLPAGFLADMIGGRRLMVAGELILGLSLFGQVTTTSPNVILLYSLMGGLGTALISVASQPYLAQITNDRERQQVFSLSYSIFLGMGVVGNLVAALAKTIAPSLDPATAYRLVLVSAALLNFIAATILSRQEDVVFEGKRGKVGDGAEARLSTDVIKTIASFGWFRFIVGLGAGLSIPFFNIYFKSRFGLSTFWIGVVFGIQSIVAALFAFHGPRVTAWLGRVKGISFLQAASLPFLFLLAFSPFVYFAVFAFWARACLMRTSTPLYRSYVMDRVGPSFRGRAASVYTTLWHWAHAIGAWVSGRMIEKTDFTLSFCLTAAVYACAALWLYWSFAKDEEGEKEGAIPCTTVAESPTLRLPGPSL